MKVPTKCCSNPNCTAVNPQSVFEFSLKKCNSDGLQYQCKACEKLYREDHRAERRQYREEHRAERRQYDKLRYEVHKEERQQYNKSYYEAHKEEKKEESRQSSKLYREEHKEEIAIRQRKRYFDRRDTQDFINIMVAINIVNEKLANKRRGAC